MTDEPASERCDFTNRYWPKFCEQLAPLIDDPKRKGFGWRTDWMAETYDGKLIPSGKARPWEGPFAGLFYHAEWGKPGKQIRTCPFCETPVVPPHRRPKPPDETPPPV